MDPCEAFAMAPQRRDMGGAQRHWLVSKERVGWHHAPLYPSEWCTASLRWWDDSEPQESRFGISAPTIASNVIEQWLHLCISTRYFGHRDTDHRIRKLYGRSGNATSHTGLLGTNVPTTKQEAARQPYFCVEELDESRTSPTVHKRNVRPPQIQHIANQRTAAPWVPKFFGKARHRHVQKEGIWANA